jgi:hypothetical protein
VKAALRAGDIAAAGRFMHSEKRGTYETMWKQLPPAQLTGLDQIMTTIRLVRVDFASAEYEMLRQENGETFSYPVRFGTDRDGLWREFIVIACLGLCATTSHAFDKWTHRDMNESAARHSAPDGFLLDNFLT